MFAPQKVPFSKISDDAIACDLWFGPPPPPPPKQKSCLRLYFNNAKIILRWQWYFLAEQCTMPFFKKNANIFLKIEINFARQAWQLPMPKPHRKLVCYHKKVKTCDCTTKTKLIEA